MVNDNITKFIEEDMAEEYRNILRNRTPGKTTFIHIARNNLSAAGNYFELNEPEEAKNILDEVKNYIQFLETHPEIKKIHMREDVFPHGTQIPTFLSDLY